MSTANNVQGIKIRIKIKRLNTLPLTKMLNGEYHYIEAANARKSVILEKNRNKE